MALRSSLKLLSSYPHNPQEDRIMELHLKRIHSNKRNTATLGVLRVEDSVFTTVEDGHHFPKIKGKTRISAGRYLLDLRRESPMATRYRNRFGAEHLGMVWIRNVPGFEFVYIHIGNDNSDTEGCPLLGTSLDVTTMRIGQSRIAYESFYPMVIPRIASGEDCYINITEEFI